MKACIFESSRKRNAGMFERERISLHEPLDAQCWCIFWFYYFTFFPPCVFWPNHTNCSFYIEEYCVWWGSLGASALLPLLFIFHLFASHLTSTPRTFPFSLSRCFGCRGNRYDLVLDSEGWKWTGSHGAFSPRIVAAWNRIINAILSCICSFSPIHSPAQPTIDLIELWEVQL